MSWSRPTLSDLKTRITSDLATRLIGVSTVLRRSAIAVFGTVIAGAIHLVYGYIQFGIDQFFLDTATGWFLDRWGAIFNVPRKLATYNTGPVTLTAVPGSILPAGSVLVRSDGEEYTLNADVDFPTGTADTVTATGQVTASDSGTLTACDAGLSLTIQNPAVGVSPTAAVAAGGITGAIDTELDDPYRARILFRIANPDRGGSDADYVFWAESQPGVTRAWTYGKWLGAGTVGVAFVCDGQANIIPTGPQVAAVQAALKVLKPSHADLTVFAPTAVPLNFTIHLNPDTPALRAAVIAELQDLLTSEGAPSGTLLLSHIEDAIGAAVGSGDFVLTAPAANQNYTNYQIPTMGNVTWA